MNNKDFVQDHPIPGASLTQSKAKKLPFENPPEITDLQEAAESMWNYLSSEETLPQLYRMLRQDVPVTDIAQVLTYSGFANGKWNFDLNLLLLEPTVYQIMHLAHQGGVKYVFSKEIPDLNAKIRGEDKKAIEKALESNEPMPGLMSDTGVPDIIEEEEEVEYGE